jgi:amidase
MSTSKLECRFADIRKTNPITEVNFDSALLRAKELDEYLAKNGSPIGPLHGLPLSVKDVFDIEGLDSTVGYAAWAYEPKSSKTQLLEKLHEAGAILYVKTAIPRKLRTLGITKSPSI